MITVALTRRDLVEKRIAAGLDKACDEGLALFDSLKAHCDEQRAREGKPARRGIVLRWTRVHALWFATVCPDFSAWMTGSGLLPAMGFEGADLRGADLRGADLCGANLCGADLRGADLCGADLAGAYLRGADLAGAYLRGADLCGAYLCGADLCGADLCGADLGDWERGPDGYARRLS